VCGCWVVKIRQVSQHDLDGLLEREDVGAVVQLHDTEAVEFATL